MNYFLSAANGVRLRPATSQWPLLRLRRQRLQLCQELHEVLRRLRQSAGVGDS